MRSPKGRILYCEDDPDAREMMHVLLLHNGYEIVCAEDGHVALHLAQHEEFDLFLLDNWMPGMSGEDVTRAIRQFNQITPILFYSGAAHEADKQAALRAGAQAYLTKPPDFDLLLAEIERLMTTNNASV